MSSPRYPAWVHELDRRRLVDTFGATTLARGQKYADEGRVGSIAVGSGSGGSLIQARVRGSSYHAYVALLSFDSTTGRMSSRCSCPVGSNCKHGAALLWHLRTVNLRAMTPAWQRAMDEVTSEARAISRTQPLALQVTRTGSATVTLRPLVWGASERWIKSGVNWDSFTYSWHGHYDDQQRSALAGLARSRSEASANHHYYSRRTDTMQLDEAGASVWHWLGQAIAAGVELVPGHATPTVRLSPTTAALTSRLSRADGGLQLRTFAVVDDIERPLQFADLIGDPPHGFVLDSGDNLVLVPFSEPLSRSQQALLLRHHRLQIPHDEIPSFAAQYYPTLRRMTRLRVDDDVDLPETEPPRLLLRVDFQPDHVCTLRWAFRYRVGSRGFDLSVDGSGERPAFADPVAEARLLDELPDGPWPTTGPAERRRLAEEARLVGPPTAALAGRLDELRAFGVIVEVSGEAADYRFVDEAPQVSLSLTDTEEGTDWFNLAVEVSIGDEKVEYRELFTALATGEQHLILPSGTWFSLDRPELEQLRSLIAEARALDPGGDGQLRLRTEHAGLWEELVSLGVVAEQSATWTRAAAALLDLAELPQVPLPTSLRATLRPYQEVGFRWLHFLHTTRLGGILADDMGLGKTLQTLALACALKEAGELDRPLLVVAPTSVLGTWAAEAARFAPDLRVTVVSGTAKKRTESVAVMAADADLLVTSYTLLRLDDEEYLAQAWASVVLDEAQFVKNRQSSTYQAVRKLRARTKLAVTGTPLENNLMDLWSLLSIVSPGLFADPGVFTTNYRKPIESGQDPDALARLHRRVRPLMLRRTKEAVAAELPPKQEQVLAVELSPGHRRLYDKQLAAERKKVLGLVDDLTRNRITILASLTLLRQLALSPALVMPDQAAVSAKIDALVELVTELAAEGHRALVFSQFTTYLRMVRERLESEKIGAVYLDGRTRDRAARIDQFRTGDDPVFLISLKAGGFGLTLTEADYVFVLDPWWNPAAETQAIDRTHRIGQDKHVMVYRLVSADTIEEKVVALQQRKRDLFAQVVGSGADLAAPLTAEDIRGLLQP